MKQMKWFNKAMSGLMAVLMLLSVAAFPIPAFAAENWPEYDLSVYVDALPLMEEVIDQLDENERVSAGGYEVTAGAEIDLNTDFTNICFNVDKVKVSFFEAKNASGQDFSAALADSYQAIYYAEPYSGNPAYRFSRTVTVTDPVITETEEASEIPTEEMEDPSGEKIEDEEADADLPLETMEATNEADVSEGPTEEKPYSEEIAEESIVGPPIHAVIDEESEMIVDPDGDGMDTPDSEPEESANDAPEEALQPLPEETERKEIYEWEYESVTGILVWASEEDRLDFLGSEGDMSTENDSPMLRAATGQQTVTITKGADYHYSDYGLGDYVTSQHHVSFGNVSAVAICVQPALPAPPSGVYTISSVSGNTALAKVLYYADEFFNNKHPDFSAGKRFIIKHLAASYANGSDDAFILSNETAQSLAKEMYNYCNSRATLPSAAMSFSDTSVKAYRDGSEQRTKNITFSADSRQRITINLPSGVRLHNVSTGSVSEAGASVQISGGTKFYFSAPMTQARDTGTSWSSTMKGSITKEYKTYKISVPGNAQDLALIFGEPIEKQNEVSLRVEWLALANIYITKADEVSGESLSGAVFGVYSDEACTQLITEMPATDANGASTVEIVVTQDTVYLKEITPPKGYVYNASAMGVKVVPGQDSNLTITNKEIMGSLTIYKEGEVLTGVNSVPDEKPILREGTFLKKSSDDLEFQYELRCLPGACYEVTAGEDIIAADGSLVFQQGDVVAKDLMTGEDGSVKLENLHLGTYIVTETGAPTNYTNHGESRTVILSADDPNQEIVSETATFVNERQKVSVSIIKVDRETQNTLPGGVYGLFAGDAIIDADGNAIVAPNTLIQTVITNYEGLAEFTVDLPLNHQFYVKELEAPGNYIRNEDDVYSFSTTYTDETEAVIKFSYTFENERVTARIDLTKMDVETGARTQGDASLSGATYGLYARYSIIHPDGKTGVIYPKDYQIATLTTDSNGKAFIEDLYMGLYYIKELVPSEGYLLDATEYDVDCYFEGDLTPVVRRSVTSKEQVIKQPFQIIKAANNGKTDADLLSGVGFTTYLVSSLTQNADGSYDLTHAEPVVIAEDGQTEIFTDDRGYAQTIPLPYGKYLVRETSTPHNFSPVEDFIVTVSENNPTEPQVWRVLLDEEFSAKLKIVKKDAESKKPVLVADTEFRIYDMDNRKYVEQITTYPETVVHKSYFTDANGYLILPNNLLPGHYRIEEVSAPEGYTLNTAGVEVIIDCDAVYEMDSVSGDAVITVELENQPVKGRLEIRKQGEVLKSYGKDFLYELRPLAGAEFAVYASEDIYTPDHQTDANGNRIVIHAKDTLVTTVVTDENGLAVIENLPLGSYYVKETKAPASFVLSNQIQSVTFNYKDQKTPVIERSMEFVNGRQKVSITVEKQDAQNGNRVSGAVFGFYTKEAISVNGKVIVAADKLLQEVTTNEQGQAVFRVDLPLGYLFYVKELKAPAGFVSSDEVLEFAPNYQGQDISVVTLAAVKKNEPTRVSVTKSDITTGVELDGATLTILDKKGHVVERWTSERNKPHIIQYLTAGETYTLREEYAPYGYLRATDVTFTVQDTAEIQKVEMKDTVPTALLIVTKKGEFLDKVTVGTTAKGYMEHIFEYVTGSLTEVTFEVYAAEDIKAADGVSVDYYKKDQLVGTITTDNTGIASLGNLPVGKYYVKEVSTAHGYVLDQEPRYVDLSYRDQNTSVVSFDENWQNNRQRVTVHVQKVEKDSNTPLAGGVFGLFTAEDIKSASGKTLIKKDTLIELKSTDAEGKITFIADLPVDGKYYVQEQYAPNGYVTDHTKREFAFDYGSEEEAEIVYEFLFENEPTTVAFSKLDITGEHEIPGAHLEVRDNNGNLIEEWVSTETPHIIQRLHAGKEYSLIETKPADGYVTAEKVAFTIDDSYNLQRVEMKDDVTKVEVSKTDITTGKELPGAKLTILDKDGKVMATWVSTDKPTYIEKLPIGDYTLCEESAPNGYLKAENVKFSVKDTGEIQKVEMKDSPIKVPDNPDTPKTGDAYKPALLVGSVVLGLVMLGASVVLAKKKRYK